MWNSYYVSEVIRKGHPQRHVYNCDVVILTCNYSGHDVDVDIDEFNNLVQNNGITGSSDLDAIERAQNCGQLIFCQYG
tara:strand:+ start:207 stop:440 length:234 start_codon:yes stop_codon:yes gene_type:complete